MRISHLDQCHLLLFQKHQPQVVLVLPKVAILKRMVYYIFVVFFSFACVVQYIVVFPMIALVFKLPPWFGVLVSCFSLTLRQNLCDFNIYILILTVEGHSIYIRNLPFSMTAEQLEVEFKKFGPIKPGGIQVRNNKVGIGCIKCIEYILSSAFPDMVLSPHCLSWGLWVCAAAGILFWLC